MAATVYGTSRFGVVSETSATGLLVGSFTTTYVSETAFAKNHIGCDVSMSVYNDSSEISMSGVIAVKTTGLVPAIAAVITVANSSADSLSTNSKGLFTTPAANAGVVVTGANLTRANAEFETGEVTAIYKPLIATNAWTTLT